MPLTNAQKQSRQRQRTKEKLARYEGALREILKLDTRDVHDGYDFGGNYVWQDYVKLDDVKRIVASALDNTNTKS